MAVDPGTLVPDGSAEPIVTGAAHDGVVSPNGRWALIRTWDHDRSTGEETNIISLVEVASGTVVASAAGYSEATTVNDDGVAHSFEQGSTSRIMRLDRAGGTPIDAELPTDAYPLVDTLSDLGDGRMGYLATSSGLGPVSLVLVDDGETRVTIIDEVIAGSEETSQQSGVSVFENITPAVAWDPDRDRALVVSADDELVVIVDLVTGETSPHPWTTATGLFDQIRFGMATARAKGIDTGSTRHAHLTGDGASLFVATRTSELSGGDDRWTATTKAEDLLVIDTTTWVATDMGVSAWHLDVSPDGTRLLATGAVITSESTGDSTIDSGPVHVVAIDGAEVIGEFQPTAGDLADVAWSPGSDVFYMISSNSQTTIDIVDISLGQVVGSVAFREMSLVGEAGLMAFHLDEG